MNYIRLFYADVTIGAKLTLDAGQATTSVKSFKSELKDASQELLKISAQFGATSKEAAAAAKRVAEMRDAVGDAKSLVDAFNPDTKFRAFGASINTVVGGFTALQGVLGLVGVESEEVQKTLLKVQSALAFSQGISQLQEGVQTFKNLSAVIQQTAIFQKANAAATALAAGAMRLLGISTTQTGVAFNVLKGAIIATGIGALVVAIGFVVSKVIEWTDATNKQAKAQEELKKQTDFLNASLNRQLDFLDRRAKLERLRAEARGDSEEQLAKLDEAASKRRVKAAESELRFARESGADTKALQATFNQETEREEIRFLEDKIKRNKEAEEQRLKDAEKNRRDLERIEKEHQQKMEELRRIGLVNLAEGIKEFDKNRIEQEDAARKQREATDTSLLVNAGAIAAHLQNLQKDTTLTQKEQSELRQAIDQAEFDNKQKLAQATASILSALSQLIGQQTVAGKVLAVAGATIDTYAAVAAVLKNAAKTPAGGIPGYAIAQAVSVGLFGLLNVKKIIATKVPGAGGGGQAPNLAVQSPLTPQRPQNTTTQLDQTSLNAIGNATTRAYVLESDVSGNQERVRRLNRAARIG